VTTLRHAICIDAPLDRVWRVLADLAAVQLYNPMVTSARLLGAQREGVGAARRCELRPKGWVEERVWEWIPERALGLEVAASEWPLVFMKWRTELEPHGASTHVAQEMSYRVKFGPLGALMNVLVMRRKLDHGVRDVFAQLKRHVESAQASEA
jgi:uncharacterized membrane protein